MQKNYLDRSLNVCQLPLLIRSENSQQADISATTTTIYCEHCPAKRQQISSILSIIVIKFEFDKQPCILLQT